MIFSNSDNSMSINICGGVVGLSSSLAQSRTPPQGSSKVQATVELLLAAGALVLKDSVVSTYSLVLEWKPEACS